MMLTGEKTSQVEGVGIQSRGGSIGHSSGMKSETKSGSCERPFSSYTWLIFHNCGWHEPQTLALVRDQADEFWGLFTK